MEQIKKILFNKIDPFIQFLKFTKRSFIFRVTIVGISCTFFLFAIFSFIIFRYYSDLVHKFYSSLLESVYLYAPYFVKTESYNEDFVWVCRKLKEKEGIEEVWVVDRSGRLIYHTDEKMRDIFTGKRLPEEYRRSVEKVWNFSDGYPVVEFLKAGSLFKIRSSIPLYITGKSMYDFILGIDADRFLMPGNFPDRIFLYLLIGGFILTAAVVFIPLYFWVGNLIDDLNTNARVLAGSLETEITRGLPSVEGVRGEEAPEEVPIEEAPVEEKAGKLERKPQPEEKKGEEVELAEEEAVGEKLKVKKPAREMAEEKGRVGEGLVEKKIPPAMLLIDKKQQLLQKRKVAAKNLHLASFSLRTRSPYGNYILYNKKNDSHLYVNLLCVEREIEKALTWLDKVSREINRVFQEIDIIHELPVSLNDWLLEEKETLDFSFLFFSESNGKLVYSSLGSSSACYVKANSDKLKEIVLSLPKAGSVTTDELKDLYKYGEIDFAGGDILFLIPHAEVGQRVGVDFIKLLSDEVEVLKTLDVEKIISHIQERLEERITDRRSAPEVGFVAVRFI